jgi:hypothetical protein
MSNSVFSVRRSWLVKYYVILGILWFFCLMFSCFCSRNLLLSKLASQHCHKICHWPLLWTSLTCSVPVLVVWLNCRAAVFSILLSLFCVFFKCNLPLICYRYTIDLVSIWISKILGFFWSDILCHTFQGEHHILMLLLYEYSAYWNLDKIKLSNYGCVWVWMC